jgi:Ca2+-binding EF-hand superfamily protein
VENNPLGERLCKAFTIEGQQIDFKEFVKALALFHSPAHTDAKPSNSQSEEEKLMFLFRMYDADGDGLLSQEEIRGVLRQLVGASLNETQLVQIVERTCQDVGTVDDQGRIDFEGFSRIFQNHSISGGVGGVQ